jgi:hypothetical protein
MRRTVNAGASDNERPLFEPVHHGEEDVHIAFSNDVMQSLRERSSVFKRHLLFPPAANSSSRGQTVSRTDANGERLNGDTASDDHPNRPFKIGRNSTFHDLSEEEREKLGGVEYRAIRLLFIIVPTYFVLWQLLGCLAAGAYLAKNKASVTEENGLNPW